MNMRMHSLQPLKTSTQLSPKFGDVGNREGGISWGCLTPPLLHRTGWSDSANSPSLSCIASRKRRASPFMLEADNQIGFAQLQDSEASSQRIDFDRSTGRFAAMGGEFVGVNTLGGPADWRALSRSARSCSFCLFANSAETASRRWASRKSIYTRSIYLRSSAVGLGPAISKFRSCMKS
jgi:hypothetical protein